jgi:hypothetical protein
MALGLERTAGIRACFISVEPVEHHLGPDRTSDLLPGRLASLANFTAEPGKLDYFRVRTNRGPSGIGDGSYKAPWIWT